MKKLLTLAIVALTLGSCKKEIQTVQPINEVDTGRKMKLEICCNNDITLTQFKINGINKYSNDWVSSNVTERINAIAVGDSIYIHTNYDIAVKHIKLTVFKTGSPDVVFECDNYFSYIIK